MKITLFFFAALFAVIAAESPLTKVVQGDSTSKEAISHTLPNPYPLPPFFVSHESIGQLGKDFGRLTLKGLKELGKTVGRDLLGHAVQVVTDGLHLKPTKEAEEGLNSGTSTEGIFNATGYLIFKRAGELAVAHAAAYGPSHEAILSNLGPFYKIHEAEQNLHYHFNQSFHPEGPGHEGILGVLGGLALNGLGNLVGGPAGNALNAGGNNLGSIYYALPPQHGQTSHEGILSQLGPGILRSAGQLVIKGAASAAKTAITGTFRPIDGLLKLPLWVHRGYYKGYPDIQAPGKEAILHARAKIHRHPEAQSCIDAAERNLTQIYDEYVKNGHGCAAAVHPHGNKIVAHVFDIVLDAVKRVEDAHREAGNCFDKIIPENKIACLDKEVPAQIEEHKKKFLHYGQDLAEFVKKFSDLNTQFDVCLTKHLGDIRAKVYNIVYDFHKCVGVRPRKSSKKVQALKK